MDARDLEIGQHFRFPNNLSGYNYVVHEGVLYCVKGNYPPQRHVLMRIDGGTDNRLPYVILEPAQARGYVTHMGPLAEVEALTPRNA